MYWNYSEFENKFEDSFNTYHLGSGLIIQKVDTIKKKWMKICFH